MNGYKDLFSLIIVDEDMPDGVAAIGELTPKVRLTIFENKTVTTVYRDDWPEGMSEDAPIATVADVNNPRETVFIVGKPITGVRIQAVIKGVT